MPLVKQLGINKIKQVHVLLLNLLDQLKFHTNLYYLFCFIL